MKEQETNPENEPWTALNDAWYDTSNVAMLYKVCGKDVAKTSKTQAKPPQLVHGYIPQKAKANPFPMSQPLVAPGEPFFTCKQLLLLSLGCQLHGLQAGGKLRTQRLQLVLHGLLVFLGSLRLCFLPLLQNCDSCSNFARRSSWA